MAKIFKHRTDVAFFDYKDFKTLQRYVNQYGQIETRKKTGLTEMQQRQLARAIKRARHIALLPFVASNQYNYMNKNQPAEELWRIVYVAFEVRPVARYLKVFGMGNSQAQIKHRLLNNISALKQDVKNTKLQDAVRADLMLAQTLEVLADTDTKKALKQLDLLSGRGD